ncbi:DUF2326 domain-containing protein [Pseudogulbenkiania ferrooxidans]|uniref:DUF2326 domain-containing protein n=1 Tax=Pseudogulbenkiania ferrooxidans TaxID=549169 RepID=UPI0004176964|nr:DUF2326 domain-containing protein [Pseudogulbenkiania ferrooxidans]
MKLSRIYCNKQALFPTIDFNEGLSVILAEIREQSNKNKDTHNLGKSTLSALLDFCLLAKKSSDIFLFSYKDTFIDFVFYLEIEMKNGSYLTIKRSTSNQSKIYFKKHTVKKQDYTHLSDEEWDHAKVPFERARTILDGYLDFGKLGEDYDFRKPIGYSLRRQNDYDDVFHLTKFKGSHSQWKPYLAHILGFDSALVSKNYELTQKIESLENNLTDLHSRLPRQLEELDKLDAVLQLKRAQVKELDDALQAFNFSKKDSNLIDELVEKIDIKISDLNSQKYYLSSQLKKIEQSLQVEPVKFRPQEAEIIFSEAGVHFPEQLKKSYNDLIEFNKTITDERRAALKNEMANLQKTMDAIIQELATLNEERSKTLSFLSNEDSFKKYKSMSKEVNKLSSEVLLIEERRSLSEAVLSIKTEIAEAKSYLAKNQAELVKNIHEMNSEDSRYSAIRYYFSRIIKNVLDRDAIISTTINKEGNLQFKAEILGNGEPTAESKGHSYKKLLCIAFDLAVAITYRNESYPKFLYHDGALETLDNRKKLRLIEIVRDIGEKFGIQEIITLIDSDLPYQSEGKFRFKPDEIICLLHDQGDEGRLFKMPKW